MSRLEVDVKSIQKLIKSRAMKARKSLGKFEGQAEQLVKILVRKGLKSQKEGKKQFNRIVRDVQRTVKKSPLVKNLKKSMVYSTALDAKDELEKRLCDVQEKVFEVLQVPTRQELDRLNRKIDKLHAQLNAKRKAKPRTRKTA